MGQRGGTAVLLYLAFPLVGLVSNVWLMASLDHLAIYLGLGWLCLGMLYLTAITRGFSKQPPEMHFEEA